MPKRNKHSQKAQERKAAKQGEITPAIRTYTKETSADPTHEDSRNNFDDSASEDFETGPVVASTSSTIPDNDVQQIRFS